MSNAEYNVRLFGAAGDGKTKDTFAIQQAIEACAASGGGRVVLPAGTYVSGTLFLKSNVELHLASGALLMGSPDQDDYNKTDLFPENTASARDFTSGAHLIIAYDQDNVSITGFGEINGNSSAFFGDLPPGKFATYRFKNGDHTLGPWRTGQMVFFCRCRRVAVHDIALRDSPYWTLFVHGCEDVQIRGLTITNPPGTRNGDGIDIDCSRYVRVSDCLIRTGDDCITVRGNKRPLGDYAQPCEHIIVTNCVLSSPCNAIRVGVGNGEVRDCLFSHIVVKESRNAISIISSYTEGSPGVNIERLHFSDFIIDALNPLSVTGGPGGVHPAGIRDISFSRFRITASAGAQLAGSSRMPIEHIRFSDIVWEVKGGTDNLEFVNQIPEVLSRDGYPGAAGGPALPCVLYGTHVIDAVFRNIRVYWKEPSAVWRYGIVLEDSSHVEIRDAVLRPPVENEGAAIMCRRVELLDVRDCRSAPGMELHAQIES